MFQLKTSAIAPFVVAACVLALAAPAYAMPGRVISTPAATVPPPAATDPVDDPCTPGQRGVIYGTPGKDILTGTLKDDVICGLAGDDVILGLTGADQIYAGGGKDLVVGGWGDDYIDGGDGADVLKGDLGNDEISGGGGDDRIIGELGQDSLDGGEGADLIDGGPGNDRLFGGPGDDKVLASLGDDLLNGDAGTDLLDGSLGQDTCLTGETLRHCEKGPDSLPQAPISYQPTPEPAGDVTFAGGPGLPGVAVTVRSTGGLSPNDIHVRPDRQASYGLAKVSASLAYDFSLTNPGAMTSARVTLPYDPARLRVPESELRLATLDRASQLWVPVTGPVTVDAVANTVTMDVQHFSLLSVVQEAQAGYWTKEALTRMFGNTPVRCVPAGSPGSTAGVDVAFVIDSSGSMATNDPSAARVAAAKDFLARLRPGDRAAVVDFDDSARTVIGLTDVSAATDRQRVSAALDTTANAVGGTDLSAAVRQGTAVLATGGPGRLRLAVLLTDGESTYDTSLTSAAASAGVSFATVALGPGAASDVLQGIADGTGGRAFTAATADQLAGLYDELAGDIIDDGTDTDGDGLTDCEERNGLFSPAMLWLPDLRKTVPLDEIGVFSFPDPTRANTDGDGTSDGQEVIRRNFSDNPAFANAFQVLIAAGRTTYFELVTGRPDLADTDSDGLVDPTYPSRFEACPSAPAPGPSPFDWDSDFDSVSDGVECANGANPLRADTQAYGVPGLPSFSLFTPAAYRLEPDPVVPYLLDGADDFRRLQRTNRAVFYDNDYNCSGNCTALNNWAAAQPDDNGFGICINGFGDCVDDASQIRDKVREIVERQRVFDDDGLLRNEYVGSYATLLCAGYYNSTGQCASGQMIAAAGLLANNLEPKDLDRGATRTLRSRVGTRPTMDPEAVGRIVTTIVAISILYRDATLSPQERQETVDRAVRTCTQTDLLAFYPFNGTVHPCQFVPLFLPGETDAGGAARNDAAAIAADPTKLVLQYATRAEREPIVSAALAADGKASGTPRFWYRQYSPCNVSYPTTTQCDEYPFFASTRSGPPTGTPAGTRLQLVPATENLAEGNAYGAFTRACGPVNTAPRTPFAVVPLVGPAAAPTTWICPR